MKLFAVISVLVLALASTGLAAKTFNRCSLARELQRLGMPRDQLARWTCIAEHESDYRTWVVGPPNTDGSQDHGIFQINDRYWCQPSNGRYSSNGCHLNCNRLTDDNLQDDVNCAKQILKEQGWAAWSTWKYCNGALPSIDSCF